jgi:hypothetical protein
MLFPKFEASRNRKSEDPPATSATPATFPEHYGNGSTARGDPSTQNLKVTKDATAKNGAAVASITRDFPENSKPASVLAATNVAGVADVAGGFHENRKIPKTAAEAAANWRDCANSLNPLTEKGERIKTAVLAFLHSDLVYQAIEHGWGMLQLFGVMRTKDAAVLDRRADCKGVLPFIALAPWKDTKLQSFSGTYAEIVTGSGAVLRQPKGRMDTSTVVPFWESEAV